MLILFCLVTLMVAAGGQEMEDELRKRKYLGPRCSDPAVISTLPFCLTGKYEKHVRPNETARIILHLAFDEIVDINDQRLTMTLQMKTTMIWADTRVCITFKGFNRFNTDMKKSRAITQSLREVIWMPDLMIHGLKELSLVEVLQPQAGLFIYENATFEYSFAARITIGCDFTFDDYPMDIQECTLAMGSFGYSAQELLFKGSHYQTRDMQRGALVDRIEFVELAPEERNITKISADRNETFSVYGFKVRTRRPILRYLLKTYIPAAICVSVSWISFLVNRKEVTGRLALLVTLSLVEINIFNAAMIGNTLSKSISALELYVMVCLICVTLAVVEYMIVIFRNSPVARKFTDIFSVLKIKKRFKRLKKLRKKSAKRQGTADMVVTDSKTQDTAISAEKSKQRRKSKKCLNNDCLDNASIFFFPIFFFAFNLVYWLYYLLK